VSRAADQEERALTAAVGVVVERGVHLVQHVDGPLEQQLVEVPEDVGELVRRVEAQLEAEQHELGHAAQHLVEHVGAQARQVPLRAPLAAQHGVQVAVEPVRLQ